MKFIVWFDNGCGWHRENTYDNKYQAERECRCLVYDDGYDAASVENEEEETLYVCLK